MAFTPTEISKKFEQADERTVKLEVDMAGVKSDLTHIKDDLTEIKFDLKTVIVKLDNVVKKDECIGNRTGEDGIVTQREMKRSYKLIYWILSIIGVLTAAGITSLAVVK